jgi:hypothetical protein
VPYLISMHHTEFIVWMAGGDDDDDGAAAEADADFLTA